MAEEKELSEEEVELLRESVAKEYAQRLSLKVQEYEGQFLLSYLASQSADKAYEKLTNRMVSFKSGLAVGGIALIAAIALGQNYAFNRIAEEAAQKIAAKGDISREVAKHSAGDVELRSYLLDNLGSPMDTPVGSVIPYVGPETSSLRVIRLWRSGWLLCNGLKVFRSPETMQTNLGLPKVKQWSNENFDSLVEVLSGRWGNNTQNGRADSILLPDLRGMFLRGRADSVSQDPGLAMRRSVFGNLDSSVYAGVGSFQDESIGEHKHIRSNYSNGYLFQADSPEAKDFALQTSNPASDHSFLVRIEASTGNPRELPPKTSRVQETRPRNVSVNYLIKVW